MSRVCLFATGGTIASQFDAKTGDVRVKSSSSYFCDLARAWVPDIGLEAHDFCNVGSYAMEFETAFRLVAEIGAALHRDDVNGVVVTHGTDTLEETAYLADLIIDSPKPVVFTGAQRAADEPDTDGPRNLADAIRVAASQEARGLGVVVVFEREVHAARDATKTHTSRLGTFQSGGHGALGEIDTDGVVIHRRPAIRHTFQSARIEPRVDLIKMGMGVDRRLIDCSLSSGAKAIVLEAFGRGNVTQSVLEGVQAASQSGVPVIVTSRCLHGRVAPVYGASGGAGLCRAGAVFGGDLTGVKARVLLSVLLGEPGYAPSYDSLADAVKSVAG